MSNRDATDYPAAQATHADKIRGLREHYESVSMRVCDWHSGIVRAIDALEREPDLLAQREALRDALQQIVDDALKCPVGKALALIDQPLVEAARNVLASLDPVAQGGQ